MGLSEFITGGLIIVLFAYSFVILTSSNKTQEMKKMQEQLDELCKLTGHEDLINKHQVDADGKERSNI